MNYPLVTICLLTYNAEKTLKKTLESIINQTYPNFEILISDNFSSDKTLEIIEISRKQYSNRGVKIIFRKNIPDIKPGVLYDGCYDNCNGCLKSGLINGQLVSFFHSDDIYENDIIEKEAEFLIENPEAAAVFSQCLLIDKNNKIIGKSKKPKELKKKNLYNFLEIFKTILKYGNTFLITPSFMARKKILEEIGLFSNKGIFGTSADLEMWLRILKKYPIGILEDILINRRKSEQPKKDRYLSPEKSGFFKVIDYFLEKEMNSLKIEKKFLRQYEYQKNIDNTILAMNFLMKGEIEKAKEIINKSFSFQNLRAFFENIKILRIKISALKIIMFFGINLGLGKYLGKTLRKINKIK